MVFIIIPTFLVRRVLALNYNLVARLKGRLTDITRLRDSLTVVAHFTTTVHHDILVFEYKIAYVWFDELQHNPCQQEYEECYQQTGNNDINPWTVADDDGVINRTERERCCAAGYQISTFLIVEADLQLMEVSTEHLAVRILQFNLVFGELNIEFLKDVVLYLLPVKLGLIESTHVLAHEMDDIGIIVVV